MLHADGGDVTGPNPSETRQNISQLFGVFRASLFKRHSCPCLEIARSKGWQSKRLDNLTCKIPVHVFPSCLPSCNWISLQINAACIFRSLVVMVENQDTGVPVETAPRETRISVGHVQESQGTQIQGAWKPWKRNSKPSQIYRFKEFWKLESRFGV